MIQAELKLYWNKRTWIMLFCFMLISILTGFAGSGLLYGESLFEPFTVFVANHDNSFASNILVQSLKDNQSGVIHIEKLQGQAHEQSQSGQELLNDGAAAIVTIPDNFIEDVQMGKETALLVTLNANKPFYSKITALYIDALTMQLAAAQSGIYAVLEKAADSKDYQHIFVDINRKYLTLFMLRGSGINKQSVLATGDIPALWYYFIYVGLFFLTIAGILMIEPFNELMAPSILARIQLSGISSAKFYSLKFCSLLIVSVPLVALYLGALIGCGIPFSGRLFVACLLLLPAVAAVMALIGSLFANGKIASILVFFIALAILFFSGGIIPPVFMPASLEPVKRLMPYHYFFEVFKGAAVGLLPLKATAYSLVFGAATALCGYACFKRRVLQP